MKRLLTDSEIEEVCIAQKSLAGIEVCRAIEAKILAKIGERIAYLSKNNRIVWGTTHPQPYTPLYAIPFIEGEE